MKLNLGEVVATDKTETKVTKIFLHREGDISYEIYEHKGFDNNDNRVHFFTNSRNGFIDDTLEQAKSWANK